MTWISKHNKDNYYDNKVIGMAWHEYLIYLTRISKHNKDNYYNNKVVGMVGLFLLLLLAGSAGAWIWSCRWIGILFFSSTIFSLCFLMIKKIRFTSKYKFESSQAPERPALSWAAGDEQVFSEQTTLSSSQRSSLINVDKFDHVAPSYGNEFLARGNMAHRTLPKVISILLLDCLLVIWS